MPGVRAGGSTTTRPGASSDSRQPRARAHHRQSWAKSAVSITTPVNPATLISAGSESGCRRGGRMPDGRLFDGCPSRSPGRGSAQDQRSMWYRAAALSWRSLVATESGTSTRFFSITRLRVGPGRVGVGEVRSPHEHVGADRSRRGHTDGVVHEGQPDLAAHVVARRHRQRHVHHGPELPLGVVHPLHPVGQPSDVGLGRHDAQAVGNRSRTPPSTSWLTDRWISWMMCMYRTAAAVKSTLLSAPMPVTMCSEMGRSRSWAAAHSRS